MVYSILATSLTKKVQGHAARLPVANCSADQLPVVVCAGHPAAAQAEVKLARLLYTSHKLQPRYVWVLLDEPAEYGSSAAALPEHGIHLGLYGESHRQQPLQQLHPLAHCTPQAEVCCKDCAGYQQCSAVWLAAAAPA